jgi:hypothetical protein
VEGEFNMQIIMPVLVAISMLLSPDYARAYIGPGLGAGTIGLIFGVLGSICLALFAVFWYPIKNFLKKIKVLKQRETIQQHK